MSAMDDPRDGYDEERGAMVRAVVDMYRSVASEVGEARLDERVLQRLRDVPRHLFVADEEAGEAYANRPLPIGHRQTISQPFIVALMTHLLRPRKRHVVLEVGTGCGYQAAVLAGLVAHVYTIEIVAPLGLEAKERLARLGYDNVTVEVGDGHAGWPEHAPFDGIIVTAAAERTPPALVEQLKPGGRLVIPVGEFDQDLRVLEKGQDGALSWRTITPVRFVPLTGAASNSD